MADKEIRLVGSFKDDITPKLKRLSREIDAVTKSFTKMQGKLRPIARDLGVMAMASERLGSSLKSQRTGFESNIRAMQQYRSEMGKVARAQRAVKPTTLPAPRMPRAPRGGAPAPRAIRGGGGGAGIGEIAIGSAIGGVMTNAIIAGFQQGVNLMMAPMRAFGSAFAERVGDEMEDIKSAGGMFALDRKNKTPLFSSFEDAMTMQEGLNRSLAKSAAALPGATNDYVRAARGLTDTVMGAFGKNEEAFKKFATELGAREGATSEEAITKVLQRFTEQTVLLGQGQTGGMPLTMLMEQLVTRESVSVASMQARYAQLRSNPLLANMLQDAEKEINASTAGTADRFRAVMKALDNALPQEVVNKMRRSVSGLAEATRSAFLDPDTGLFGLSRELDVTVPKVNQFGQYVNAQGKAVATASQAVQETTSLFKILKDTLANFAVPILELLGVLPQIFDPFRLIAEQFKELRETSNLFYRNFNSYTKWFENNATQLFKDADKVTDPKVQAEMRKRANLLKEQAGARGGLATLNNAMRAFGVIDYDEFKANAAKLEDTSLKGVEAFGAQGMAEMSKRLLAQFVNSPVVEQIVETLGRALGAFIDTVFTAIDGILSGIESKTGNKLIDAFTRGFSKIITPERANQIADIIDRLLTKLFNMAADILINKVIPAIGVGILMAIKAAWESGPLGKFLVVVSALVMFQKAVMAAQAALMTLTALQGMGLLPTRGMPMGPGRTRGRPQVLARQAGRQTTGALGRIGAGMTTMAGGAGQAIAQRAPGVARAAGAAKGAVGAVAQAGKMKGIGLAAAGIVKLSTMAPQMAKLGKFATNFGKNIPFLNVAFAGLDFAARKAEGQDTAKAAAGAGGSLAGSVIGGAIGTAILPGIGTAIGAVVGSSLGGVVGEQIPSLMAKVGPPLQQGWSAVSNFFTQTIPQGWNTATSFVTNAISTGWNALVNFFVQLPSMLMGAIQAVPGLLKAAFDGIVKFFTQDIPFAIGYAVGFTVQMVQNAWNGLVTFFTTTLPAAWTAAVNFAKTTLQTIWNGIVTFFTSTMPSAWTAAITFVQSVLSTAWNAVISFFMALPGMMAAAWSALLAWARSLPATIGAAFASFISYAATIPGQITSALARVGTAIIDWAKGIPGRVIASLGAGFQAGKDQAKPKYNGKGRSMPLGQAIATEMKHKPPGSSLVIANSSETVIPAYKGYGYREVDIGSLRATPAAGGMGSGGVFDVNRVEVTVVDNTGNIATVADQVAEMFLTQMYKATLSFDGRAG